MIKNFVVNAALVVFSISLALVGFDLAIYLLPKDSLPRPLRDVVEQMEINSGRQYRDHPQLGFTITPKSDFVFPGEEFRFRFHTRLNFPDAGFRGGTLGGPPWGAAFGDSFTFGAGVEQAATWVARLSELTSREIINFGVPGHGPYQYTRILQKYGAPLRPKIVFYALFTNDLEDSQRFEGRHKSHKSPDRRFSIKRFLKNYSASNNLFRNLSHSFKTKLKDNTWNGIGLKLLDRKLRSPYGIPDGEFETTWATTAKQIEIAVEESKRINATFVFLYFPSKEEVYWELDKEKVKSIDGFEERIARLRKTTLSFCRSRQLLCLDLSPALKSRGLSGEKLYYPVDIHWNELGNLAVAQEIHKFLIENKLIK